MHGPNFSWLDRQAHVRAGERTTRSVPLVRCIALGGLVSLLVWQLITKELPYYLAMHAPETALALDASQPLALTVLADRRLNGETGAETASREETPSETGDPLSRWATMAWRGLRPDVAPPPAPPGPEERQHIRAMLVTALTREPLNPRALRILGQLADAEGDKAAARLYMQAAVRQSLRSIYAAHWLMVDSAEAQDFAATVRYGDQLLRKRPELGKVAYPLLAQVAEREVPADRATLVDTLVADPPWRSSFLQALPQYIRDARTPLSLLLALKDGQSPPNGAEINGYLQFLINNSLYEFAYYVWLQFLPPDGLSRVGFLVNGSFEQEPSGAPFDWTISGGEGVTIDLADRLEADGHRALFLEFGSGRARFGGVYQLVMLTPGRYRLSGRLQGELASRRGLQWRVTCLPNGQTAGETPMFIGSASVWQDFAIELEIPAQQCRTQEIRLVHASRSASEELVAGGVWYDGLRLVRSDTEER